VLQLLLPATPSSPMQCLVWAWVHQVRKQTKRVSMHFPFFAAKKPEDQLFDSIDAQDLNKTLKDCMEGLSAKVPLTHAKLRTCAVYLLAPLAMAACS
jgi:Eukaryotic DNA topoisomerase I, catalytic core